MSRKKLNAEQVAAIELELQSRVLELLASGPVPASDMAERLGLKRHPRLALGRLRKDGKVRIKLLGADRRKHYALPAWKFQHARRPCLEPLRVLDLLRRDGPLTRSEIADRLGAAAIETARVARRLLDAGKVRRLVVADAMCYQASDAPLSAEDRLSILLARCEPDEDGCMIWDGATDKDGNAITKDRDTGVRRVALIMWRAMGGEIDESTRLTMRCMKQCCVRPDHIRTHTVSASIKRAVKENPYAWSGLDRRIKISKAARAGRSKLASRAEEVRRRAAAGEKFTAIAADLNCAPQSVSNVVNYKTHALLSGGNLFTGLIR